MTQPRLSMSDAIDRIASVSGDEASAEQELILALEAGKLRAKADYWGARGDSVVQDWKHNAVDTLSNPLPIPASVWPAANTKRIRSGRVTWDVCWEGPGVVWSKDDINFAFDLHVEVDAVAQLWQIEGTPHEQASPNASLASSRPSRGRRPGTGFAPHDERLFPEIDEILNSGLAQSAYGAALQIADKIAGSGTDESRIKRLAERYNKARPPP